MFGQECLAVGRQLSEALTQKLLAEEAAAEKVNIEKYILSDNFIVSSKTSGKI